ncbi:MAG: CPBP family intramembrane glutamic endopeptidase [Anaerolineales bacterium]
MKKHPVLWFYILAFLFSWLGWVPQALQARGLLTFDHPLLTILFALLGGGGPTFAAVIMAAIVDGKDGPGRLFAALFKLRARWPWYLVAFLLMPFLAALALVAGTLFGQPFPDFRGFAWFSLLPIFIGMLISNVWEEIGWRGFALPHLQARYRDLVIVFVMGLLWELWHLPLYLNPNNPMSGLNPLLFVLFSLALTVLYTWLYNHTQGSLFFVTVFHAMSNTVAAVLLDRGVFVSSYPAVVALTAIVAAGVLLYFRRTRSL